MAITRKPKSLAQSSVDIEALINKGGSPASRPDLPKEGTASVILRMPGEILEQIDTAVKARPIRTPRNTWLLEAIHEKLAREVR